MSFGSPGQFWPGGGRSTKAEAGALTPRLKQCAVGGVEIDKGKNPEGWQNVGHLAWRLETETRSLSGCKLKMNPKWDTAAKQTSASVGCIIRDTWERVLFCTVQNKSGLLGPVQGAIFYKRNLLDAWNPELSKTTRVPGQM